MENKDTHRIKEIFGICSYEIIGGASIIFNDLMNSLQIGKVILNSQIQNKTSNSSINDFISFKSLSKSPHTWLRFLFNYVNTTQKLAQKSKGYKYVIANDFVSLVYLTPLIYDRKLKVIFFCHTIFKQTLFNRLFLFRFINRVSQTIVVPSLYLKNHLISQGIDAGKIFCIYNGISEAPLIQNNKNSTETLSICIVGLVQHQKGQDVLIDSIEQIINQGYKIKGSILGPIGNLDYFNNLKNQVHKKGLEDSIIIMGELPHEQTINFINSQDIVVCLSRYRETLPTVLLEAISLKKTVIGTRVGGIPEIIENELNGYLINPNAPEELSEAILKLKDPILRNKMGEAGYKLFKQKFSRSVFLEKHSELIFSHIEKSQM